MKRLLDCLTVLGTSVLAVVDAFWAAVGALTVAVGRLGSRRLVGGQEKQPLANFPHPAPALTSPGHGQIPSVFEQGSLD